MSSEELNFFSPILAFGKDTLPSRSFVLLSISEVFGFIKETDGFSSFGFSSGFEICPETGFLSSSLSELLNFLLFPNLIEGLLIFPSRSDFGASFISGFIRFFSVLMLESVSVFEEICGLGISPLISNFEGKALFFSPSEESSFLNPILTDGFSVFGWSLERLIFWFLSSDESDSFFFPI